MHLGVTSDPFDREVPQNGMLFLALWAGVTLCVCVIAAVLVVADDGDIAWEREQ